MVWQIDRGGMLREREIVGIGSRGQSGPWLGTGGQGWKTWGIGNRAKMASVWLAPVSAASAACQFASETIKKSRVAPRRKTVYGSSPIHAGSLPGGFRPQHWQTIAGG